jgi:hypothetical protein
MQFMLSCLNLPDTCALNDRLGYSSVVTPALFHEVVDKACRRFPSAGLSEKSARVEALIAAHAWTEAALALIELELPEWQLRRIAYDGGEWHCALSRERELPDWLDRSIEAHHPDLALALLCALVATRQLATASSRPSVPSAPGSLRLLPAAVGRALRR